MRHAALCVSQLSAASWSDTWKTWSSVSTSTQKSRLTPAPPATTQSMSGRSSAPQGVVKTADAFDPTLLRAIGPNDQQRLALISARCDKRPWR